MDNNQKTSFNISFWIFIIVAILLVVFSVQNSGAIDVQLIFWDANVSLAILLIGTFLTGLVAGALYAYSKLKRPKSKIKDTFSTEKEKSSSEILDENI